MRIVSTKYVPFPGRCVSAVKLVLNYGATNVTPTQKDQPLISLKRRPHFQTHTWSWNDHKFTHGSRRGPKPRTTVLARASIMCFQQLGGIHRETPREQSDFISLLFFQNKKDWLKTVGFDLPHLFHSVMLKQITLKFSGVFCNLYT
jgi:hypothetical protein